MKPKTPRQREFSGHFSRRNVRFRNTFFERLEDRRLLSTNVSLYRYDLSSSGLNAAETVLTPSNVVAGSFGKQFTVPLDGQVLAQPLYMSNVIITTGVGGTHNVVFVATEHDGLYAIDAATGKVLWYDTFLYSNSAVTVTTASSADVNSGDIQPEIGITGTPAIDTANGYLYVVAKTKAVYTSDPNDPDFLNTLYKVNIHDGTYTNTVIAQTTALSNGGYNYTGSRDSGPYVLGTGDGYITVSGQNRVYFNSLRQMFRPAVELVNEVVNGTTIEEVVLGSASHGDNGPYHGWMLTYNAANLSLTGVLNTSPNGGLSGIWQGDDGIVSDSQGYFYFMTGNGTFDQSSINTQGFPTYGDYGDSFVKAAIDTTTSQTNQNVNGWGLKVVDYFTPSDQQSLTNADEDLGSGGAMILPDSVGSTAHPHLLVGGGKDGRVFLIDRSNMGKFSATTDNCLQELASGSVNGILSTPAYFNGHVYLTSGYNNGPLEAFSISNGQLSNSATFQTSDGYGDLDGSPVVSANGTANGIVWALSRASGQLRAYNATNLTEVYNSSTLSGGGDSPGTIMKFTNPVVADGSVFVGTGNSLVVYGLNTPPTSAPPAPSGLTISSATGSEISLTWTVSPSSSSNRQAAFNIERSTDGTNFSQIGTAGTFQTAYSDTTVQPFTEYYYRIDATNAIGASAYSNVVNATTAGNPTVGGGDGLYGQYYSYTTAPDNPGSFNAAHLLLTRVDSSINYNWSSVSPDPGVVPQTYYEVRWTGEVQAQYSEAYTFSTVSDDGVALFINGQSVINDWTAHGSTTDTASPITLQAGKSYPIELDYFQAAGNAVIQLNWFSKHTPSEIIPQSQLFSGTAPAAPSNLQVAAISGTQVQLNWTTNSTDEDGYEIDRKLGASGTFSPVAYLPAGSNRYLDTGLVEGNTYTYEVRATNFVANSTWSNQPAVTMPTAPDPITGAMPATVTTNSVGMAWTNNDDNGTEIRIFRILGLTGNSIFVDALYFNTATNPDGEPSTYTDTGPGGRGLLPGTMYTYEVECGNIAGFSASSNFSVQTRTNAPTQLTAVAAAGQVTLSWNAPAGAQTFNIYRGTTTGGEGTTPLATGVTGTSFVDTSVTNGTQYYYKITAVDTGGESAPSAESSATPATPTALALPPTGATATAGDRTVSLQWHASAGASTYNVYRGTASGAETLLQSGVAAISYSDSGLTDGVTYYYKITSVNLLGESSPSAEVSATPQLSAPPTPINVTAAAGNNQVGLSWSAASDALTYNIYRSTAPGDEVLYQQGVIGTSFTDSNTTNGVTYYYQVSAGNGVGESNLSQEVSATPLPPLPATPASLSASALNAFQIKLTWTETAGSATSFAVQRSTDGVNFAALTTLDGTTTSFVDAAGLTSGTKYWYRLSATNLAGSSAWSSTASANPPAATTLWADADIGNPTIAGSAYEANGTVYVNGSGADIWNTSDQFHFVYLNFSGATGTIIAHVASQGASDPWAKSGIMFRNTLNANSAFAMIVITPGNSASFQSRDTSGNLYNTQTGSYTAPAWLKIVRNSSTFTGYVSTNGSTWVQVGTGAVAGMTGGSLYVGLCDTSHNAGLISSSTFDHVSINGNASFAAPTSVNASAASGTSVSLSWTNKDSYANSNQVYQQAPGSSTYSLIATVPPGATTYLDTGLTSGATYKYQIQAATSLGGSASGTSSATTPLAPLAVSALQPLAVTTTSAILSWILNSTNDTGVTVSRQVNGAGGYTLLTTLPAGSTSYSDATLQPGTLYEYQVAAIDLAGSSPTAYTGLTTVSSAPVATAVTTTGQIQLSWTASNGAVAYNVYRGLTPGGEGTSPYATVNGGASFTDSNPSSGQAYYYRVTAVNFSGESAASAEVAAALPAVAISGPSAVQFTGTPIAYTISYLDPFFATSTLSSGDITLNKTGTANGTIAVSGTGSTRTVTLSNFTGLGSLGISIAAGTASDTLGNVFSAAGPSATFAISQLVTTIAVSPSSVNLSAGTSQQFTAIAYDQYGDPMNTQPAIAWAVTAGGGGIGGTGLYMPPYANGTAVVSAMANGVSGAANITYSGQAQWNSSSGNSWSTGPWKDTTSGTAIAAPGVHRVIGDTVLFGSADGSPVTLDGASPYVAAISFNGGNYSILQGSGGALHLANYGSNNASITVSAGNQSISAPVELDSNLLIAPQLNTLLTIGNTISGGQSLSVNGPGTVTLTGTNNSYSGGTFVTAGELVVANAGAMPSGSSLTVGDAAVFGGRFVQASFVRVVPAARSSLSASVAVAASPAVAPPQINLAEAIARRAFVTPAASQAAVLPPKSSTVKAPPAPTGVLQRDAIRARDAALQLFDAKPSIDLAWVALNNSADAQRRSQQVFDPRTLTIGEPGF